MLNMSRLTTYLPTAILLALFCFLPTTPGAADSKKEDNKSPPMEKEQPKEVEKKKEEVPPSIDHSIGSNRSVEIQGWCKFSTGKDGKVEGKAVKEGKVKVILWTKTDNPGPVVVVMILGGDKVIHWKEHHFQPADKKGDWTGYEVLDAKVSEGCKIVVLVLGDWI